ncbi:MAG: polysulfide reductase NrfD [Bdellovibrionales bacterium]|jgi:protein NrfD|nr:polysulfide reductase NrfD [Bdellovibrionales bacterium]MBT3525294.1 polysulfide reductase NrfD [Bdellovibrionales bacterium]MBT7766058.1 polysulfide reductase NrfD [Bdellovibrionales bacterium]
MFSPWDLRVVLDLFLGGAGIGAFLFASFLYFYRGSLHANLVRHGVMVTPILMIIGIIFLLLEIGQPTRAMFSAPFMINSTSILSWGTLLQGAFIIISLYLAFKAKMGQIFEVPKALMVVGSVGALLVGFYHGLLLTATGRVAWDGLVPVMFMVGSLTSGYFLVTILDHCCGERKEKDKELDFPLFFLSLLVVQFVTVFFWRYALFVGGEEQQLAHQFISGNCQLIWILVIHLIGMFLPGVMMLREILAGKKYLSRNTAIIAGIAVFVGVFALKALVIGVGQL